MRNINGFYFYNFSKLGPAYQKKEFFMVFSLALSLISFWSQATMCYSGLAREKRGDSQE